MKQAVVGLQMVVARSLFAFLSVAGALSGGSVVAQVSPVDEEGRPTAEALRAYVKWCKRSLTTNLADMVDPAMKVRLNSNSGQYSVDAALPMGPDTRVVTNGRYDPLNMRRVRGTCRIRHAPSASSGSGLPINRRLQDEYPGTVVIFDEIRNQAQTVLTAFEKHEIYVECFDGQALGHTLWWKDNERGFRIVVETLRRGVVSC